MVTYHNLAQDILEHVGGGENIQTVGHCLTRLRFVLKDAALADTVYFSEHPDIFNVIQAAGQYQLVIGHQVPDVYDALIAMTGLDDYQDFTSLDKKTSVYDRFTAFIIAVMRPCLGVMVAAVIMKSFVSLLTILGLISNHGALYLILDVAGDAFFQFLPLFIAYTSARYVKLNVSLGLAIASALIYPSPEIARQLTSLVGLPYFSYLQSILPVILAIPLAAIIDKKLKNWFPELFRASLLPFLILLLVVPLTLVVIGPLLTQFYERLTDFFILVSRLNPVILAILLGVSWQLLAVLGLHWGLMPLLLVQLPDPGKNIVIGIAALSSFGHLGSLLALRSEDKDRRETQLFIPISLASLGGFLEPSLYAFFLSRPFLLLRLCLVGALQGAYIGIAQVEIPEKTRGLLSLVLASGTSSFVPIALGVLLGGVSSFVLTRRYMSSKNPMRGLIDGKPYRFEPYQGMIETINCPVVGKIIPLSDMKDPVFASGAMGQGLAFEPIVGELYAPVSGYIQSLFPTQHALTLISDSGMQVLLHIGIDTVNLAGRGFSSSIKVGERVERGDLLISFDLKLLATEGFQTTTALVISNSEKTVRLDHAPLSSGRPVDEILRLSEENSA